MLAVECLNQGEIMINQYRFLMRAWDGIKMVPVTSLKVIKSITHGCADAYCYTAHEQVMKSENLMLSTGWLDSDEHVIFEQDIIHFEDQDQNKRYGVIRHNKATNQHEVCWFSAGDQDQHHPQLLKALDFSFSLSDLKFNNKNQISIVGNTYENKDITQMILERKDYD